MGAKFVLAFCASVLFAQAYSQCLNRGVGCGTYGARGALGYDSLGVRGFGYDAPCGITADLAAASSLNAAYGGVLGVTSSSAIPPTGLNVASENVYEGPVAIAGNLPFLGTVTVEGTFPSAGVGAVSYGCGNGAVGIIAEGSVGSIAPAAIAPAAALASTAGLASPQGLGYGYNGRIGFCGCNGVY